MSVFKLKSKFKPAGDQPQAIEALTKGLEDGVEHQTLLGVTGSGKTFTVANVIENFGKPTLVIAHNKTLAAQLVQEYREFFPDNAVEYFVSYYDFYQPEAYMPVTDTYIEKDAQINEEIDRLRHSTTQALLTREDVIVVASVSCIYGLGSPEEYEKVHIKLSQGDKISRSDFVRKLVSVYYERTNADLTPGTFRVVGNALEIMPPSEREIVRLELSDGIVEKIIRVDTVSRSLIDEPQNYYLFPRKHYVTPKNERRRAIKAIESELSDQLAKLKRAGKLLEVERLKRRTTYDLAMIREVGFCSGIENYSRHFDGRKEGEPPFTLIDYFPKDPSTGRASFLTVIDESHVTVPQTGGMYNGDQARKRTLIEHGFRLPSAKDNRPLEFHEFQERIGQVLYTTATPADYELEKSGKGVVQQIIRPTGLTDPEVVVKPIQQDGEYGGQVKHFIAEARSVILKGGRVIATTLTKAMAEDLSVYLEEQDIKAQYLHSDIKTMERIEILTNFRKGEFDVIVGVNLLREGLDLPEVALIGILDADKEGFLRSETSLIQIIGRAARNVEGRVILYADNVTGSIERAMGETNRRRKLQIAYNKKHGITPMSISKKIADITDQIRDGHHRVAEEALAIELQAKTPKTLIKEKQSAMKSAVKILDFETAAILRDEINELTKLLAS